jgi:hypothetical protein
MVFKFRDIGNAGESSYYVLVWYCDYVTVQYFAMFLIVVTRGGLVCSIYVVL